MLKRMEIEQNRIELSDKAQEQREELLEVIKGADMVFITCGLGGGTGSGAAPVISEIAKSLGILTIALTTIPFSFEGVPRQKIAQKALEEIRDKVDTLVVIPNDKILSLVDQNTTLLSAFGS